MISEEQVTHIRHLFHAEHWKIGTIAAELGLHPDTVRAALDTGRFRSRPRLRDRLTDSYLTSCARPCGPILACAPPLRDDWGGARKASCTSLPGIKIGDLGRKSPEPKIPQRNYLDFLSRAASSLIGYLADES